MIKAFYDAFFPWSFDIISSIKVCFSGIIRHKANIIHPFMVSERCSPHAFSIAVFLPDKSLFLCAVQSFIYIAQMFPVNEIIRPQDFTPRQRQKKEKKYKTVLFTAIMATIMFVTLWQYQNTMQNRYKNTGIWSGAQQYAETLLKKDKNLENDWLIGDESWRVGNKNTFQIRLTYYADADDAKEGRESEYQYKIHFDDVDGYVIKSEGVPEKEIVFPENK